ncbi:MAG: S-layer homology domain-containing protein [Patescibacteria group bacterium]
MRKILATLAALLTFSSALAFSDVGSNNSHKAAIDYLAQHKVVSGFPNGQFKSERSINRAELLKIVVGARGENPSPRSFNSCFHDTGNEWFAPFVCFARNQNWVEGYYDGSFKPGNSVNRAEAAKIILNALGIAFDDSKKFADVATTDWFAPFANTILSRNLLDISNFSANQKISRGEVAEMIYRILVIKNSGAVAFDASLANGFDTATTPVAIIAKSLDFSNPTQANLALSNWLIENGVWVTKPTLTFNGKDFNFDTPQQYLAALETIQKHFQILNINNFSVNLKSFIQEFATVVGMVPSFTDPTPITPSVSTSVPGVGANFTGVDLASETAVAARGGPSAQLGNSKIYIGYEVLAPGNYNPIVVKFTNGQRDWLRRDYETSDDESIGYGILWINSTTLYAVFTSRGIEEDANRDFRRFAKNGWLSEYGEGSGRQIAVIAKIDPSDGDITAATFLSARDTDGTTNSLAMTGMAMPGNNLIVSADAWTAPRRTNGQPMDRKLSAANAPYNYTIEFTPDLQTAVSASAPDFGQ